MPFNPNEPQDGAAVRADVFRSPEPTEWSHAQSVVQAGQALGAER